MLQSTDDLTVNKLVILYLLDKVKMPLSLSQITQIVLERAYTDYFSLQQYLNEMVEAGFISAKKEGTISWFTIEDKGFETLGFFKSRIPASTVKELDEFVDKNWRTLRNELEVSADYHFNDNGDCIVNCSVTENNATLLDLNVNVASKKQANELCTNWRNNASTLYADILEVLSRKPKK